MFWSICPRKFYVFTWRRSWKSVKETNPAKGKEKLKKQKRKKKKKKEPSWFVNPRLKIGELMARISGKHILQYVSI